MASKKIDEKVDSGFDIDADLDFAGFDFDAPDGKDDRKPITKFSTGFLDGLKDSAQDIHTISRVTRGVLPAGFGQTADFASDVTQNVSKTYDEVAKTVKPVIKDTKRLVTKLIPQDASFIPQSVRDKLKEWKQDEVDSIRPDLSAERQREDFLTGQMAEAFKFSVEQDTKNRVEDKAKDALKEGTDQFRFATSFGVINNISKDVSRLSKYETTITLAFQKKSLELQFRSLFALQDILTESKAHRELADKGFQDVIKNTGLPEFKKIQKSEAFMELGRNKFFGSVQSGLFGDNSKYIKDLFTNVRNKITGKVSSMASDFRMGLAGAESGADMLQSVAGEGGMVDPTELGGSIAGGFVGEKMMNRAGSWVKKNVVDGNKTIGKANDWLLDMMENKTRKAEDFRRSDEYNYKTGLIPAIVRSIQSVLPNNSVSTGMEIINGKELDNAFIYTRRTDRTINEIIPGLLSRQLQVQQMLLTGMKDIELTEFDHDKGVFDTQSSIDDKFKERFTDRIGQYSTHSDLDRLMDKLDKDKKLTPEQNKALRAALFQNSVAGTSATRDNFLKTEAVSTASSSDKQAITELLDQFYAPGLEPSKKLEFDKLHNSLRNNVGDPRERIQSQVHAGQTDRLQRIGLIRQDKNSDTSSFALSDYLRGFYDESQRPMTSTNNAQVLSNRVDPLKAWRERAEIPKTGFNSDQFIQDFQAASVLKPIFVRLHAEGFDDLRGLFKPTQPPEPPAPPPTTDGTNTDGQSTSSTGKAKRKRGKSSGASVTASWRDLSLPKSDLTTFMRGRSSNDDAMAVMPERIKNVANAGWWAPPVDAIGQSDQFTAQDSNGTGIMMSAGKGSGGFSFTKGSASNPQPAQGLTERAFSMVRSAIHDGAVKLGIRDAIKTAQPKDIQKASLDAFSPKIAQLARSTQAGNDSSFTESITTPEFGGGGGGGKPPRGPLSEMLEQIKEGVLSIAWNVTDMFEVMKSGLVMKVTRSNTDFLGAVPLLKKLKTLQIKDLDPSKVKELYQKIKATRPAALVADSVQQMREELLVMQKVGVKAFAKEKLEGAKGFGKAKTKQALDYFEKNHPELLDKAKAAGDKITEITGDAKELAAKKQKEMLDYLEKNHPELFGKAKQHLDKAADLAKSAKKKGGEVLEKGKEQWETTRAYLLEHYPDIVDFVDPTKGSFKERKEIVTALMSAAKTKTKDLVDSKLAKTNAGLPADQQFDASLPGVASFIAYKVAQLIGSGAHGGAKLFSWGGMKSFKLVRGIGNVLKNIATDDTFDVYVEGDNKPRLTATGIKAGLYHFMDNGEKLVNSMNINRPVADPAGQCVISAEELTKLYVMDIKTRVVRAYRSGVSLVKPGLNMMKDAMVKWYPKIWKAETGLVATAFKTLTSAAGVVKQGLVEALDRPIDVYVVGSPTPALYAKIMEIGGYVSAKDHDKKITRPGEIDGAVMDVTGDKPVVALTIDDLKKGIVDAHGKPIKALSGKLKDIISAVVGKGVDIAKWSWGVTRSVAGKLSKGIKGLFGELSIEINNKRSADTLGKIYEFLMVRFRPKKNKLGDPDGDGIVANSWQDYQAKKKADEEKKAKDPKAPGIAGKGKDSKDGKGGETTGLLAGISGMLSNVTGALSTFSSIFSTGLKLGGGFGKGLGMVGRGVMATAGFGLKALGMTGGLGLNLLGGALRLGVGVLGGGLGMVGSAIAGTASAVMTIGGGLLSLLASPVVLSIGAAALAGYGAYKAYQYLTRDSMTKLQRMRYVQYGFPIEDDKHAHKVFALEDVVKKNVRLNEGEAYINERGIDVKSMLEPFGLDPTDEQQQATFYGWYQKRFKPIFLSHVVACDAMTKSNDLTKADEFKGEEFKKFVTATRFDNGPYDYNKLPIIPAIAATDGKYVKAFIDNLLIDKKDNSKSKQKAIGKTAAAMAAISKDAGQDNIYSIDQPKANLVVDPKSLKASEKIPGVKAAAAAAAVVPTLALATPVVKKTFTNAPPKQVEQEELTEQDVAAGQASHLSPANARTEPITKFNRHRQAGVSTQVQKPLSMSLAPVAEKPDDASQEAVGPEAEVDPMEAYRKASPMVKAAPAAKVAPTKAKPKETPGAIVSQAIAQNAGADKPKEVAKAKVTKETGDAQDASRQQVQAIDAVRWRSYGLTKLDFDKVLALSKLERMILADVSYSGYSGAAWEGDPAAVLNKVCGDFRVSLINKDAVSNWTVWFVKRFLPVITTFASAYKRETKRVDVLEGIKTLKARQLYQIAKTTSGDSSCWNVAISPWPGYSLNTDSSSVKANLDLLESMMKSDNLSEQTGKSSSNDVKKATKADLQGGDDVTKSKSVMDKIGDFFGFGQSKITGLKPGMPGSPSGTTPAATPLSEGDPKKSASIGASPTAPKDQGAAKTNAPMPSAPSSIKTAPGALLDGENGYNALQVMPGVDINSVNPAFLKKLYGMAEEYNKITGKKFIVTSGYRSIAKQAELYEKYGPKRAAKPGSSMHEFGLAMDLNRDELNEAEKLGLMRKYGFTRPIGGEPWHMEHAATQGEARESFKRNQGLARDVIEKGAGIGGGGLGTIPNAPLGSINAAYSDKLMKANSTPVASDAPDIGGAAPSPAPAAGAPATANPAKSAPLGKPTKASTAASPAATPTTSGIDTATPVATAPADGAPTIQQTKPEETSGGQRPARFKVDKQKTDVAKEPGQSYVDRFGTTGKLQARDSYAPAAKPAPADKSATTGKPEVSNAEQPPMSRSQAIEKANAIATQGPMSTPYGFQPSQMLKEQKVIPNQGLSEKALSTANDTLTAQLGVQQKILEALTRLEKFITTKKETPTQAATPIDSKTPAADVKTIKPRNVPVPMRSSFTT